MPGFDRSGPGGDGPMTGRGMGRCASNRDDEDFARVRGRGRGPFGGGRGFGGGRQRRMHQHGAEQYDSDQELSNKISMLEDEVAKLKKMVPDK